MQTLTVSLAAFEAVLEIENASGDILFDATVEFFIFNEVTEEVNTLEFAIAPPITEGFTPNLSPAAGADTAISFSVGDLAVGAAGRLTWFLVPTDEAADDIVPDLGGVPYSIGGIVRYSEGPGGAKVEIPLLPDSVLVLPRPSLQIRFLARGYACVVID